MENNESRWMSFEESNAYQKLKRKKESIYFSLVRQYGLLGIPEGAYEEASKLYDEQELKGDSDEK